ncbi:actin-binding protein LAS17 [Ascoidea rubescens DSM 1968]|uniref:WH1-domain-containing protein n=1 Tax=Ascoidea rubescens DSM 1968 TaxID=1344418 RepID=A0A1D2VBM9_9ASCO|nr:WH1-domain-containing protein [Ascoidea rubescens DSM 1968]ODV59029.1 WH1-domain-containing protein [Ascoidea rubescens DSM 1968]
MGLLQSADKEKIKRNIPRQKNKIIDFTVARLYISLPNQNDWIYTGLSGAIVLIDDLLGHTFFLKLIDISNGSNKGVLFDHELYVNFAYNKDRTFFHTFEIDNCYVGLLFEDINEANKFHKRVVNREKYASKETLKNKNAIPLQNNLSSSSNTNSFLNHSIPGPRGNNNPDFENRFRSNFSDSITNNTNNPNVSQPHPKYKKEPPPPPPPPSIPTQNSNSTYQSSSQPSFLNNSSTSSFASLQNSSDEVLPTIAAQKSSITPAHPNPPTTTTSNLNQTSQPSDTQPSRPKFRVPPLPTGPIQSKILHPNQQPHVQSLQLPPQQRQQQQPPSQPPVLPPFSAAASPPPLPPKTPTRNLTPTNNPYTPITSSIPAPRPPPSRSNLPTNNIPPPPPSRPQLPPRLPIQQGMPVQASQFGYNNNNINNNINNNNNLNNNSRNGPPPPPPPRRGVAPPPPASRHSPNNPSANLNSDFNQMVNQTFQNNTTSQYQPQQVPQQTQNIPTNPLPLNSFLPPPRRIISNSTPINNPDQNDNCQSYQNPSQTPSNLSNNINLRPAAPLPPNLSTSSIPPPAPAPPPNISNFSAPAPPAPPLMQSNNPASSMNTSLIPVVEPERDALLASIRNAGGLKSLKKIEKSNLEKPSVLLTETKGGNKSLNSNANPNPNSNSDPQASLADALSVALNKRKQRVSKYNDDDDW